MDTTSVMTENELNILSLVERKRIAIIEGIMPDDVVIPMGGREMTALLEVMRDTTATTFKQAELRLKTGEMNNDAARIEQSAKLLEVVLKQREEKAKAASEKDIANNRAIPDNLGNRTVVPGDMDINPEKLLISDFVQND